MDEWEYWSVAGVWFLFVIAVLAGTGLCSYIKSCHKSLKELTTPPSPATVDTSSSSPPINTQITWISDFTGGDSPVLPHVPRVQPINDDLPTYDEAVASLPTTWLCSTHHVDIVVSKITFCIKFNSFIIAISCKFIQISHSDIKIIKIHSFLGSKRFKAQISFGGLNVVTGMTARWHAIRCRSTSGR